MIRVNKRLSNLMLIANFTSTLFYSMSYPYIYIELVKAVSKNYISFEQIISCISIVIFGTLWNRNGDKYFEHYRAILIVEVIADAFLFAHVLITGDLRFYFVLNVLIYAVITKNLSCGIIKMRAKVNPTEDERNRYDNNSNSAYALATIIGTGAAIVLQMPLRILFILALIGNAFDNVIYYYIYEKIRRAENGT